MNCEMYIKEGHDLTKTLNKLTKTEPDLHKRIWDVLSAAIFSTLYLHCHPTLIKILKYYTVTDKKHKLILFVYRNSSSHKPPYKLTNGTILICMTGPSYFSITSGKTKTLYSALVIHTQRHHSLIATPLPSMHVIYIQKHHSSQECFVRNYPAT